MLLSKTHEHTVKYAKWTAIDLLERHYVFSKSVRSSDRLCLARVRTTKSYNRRHRRYRRTYVSLLDVEPVSVLLRSIRKIDLMERNIRASLYILARDVCAANRSISEARNMKLRDDPVILEPPHETREREREKESAQIYLLLVIHDTLSTHYFTRKEGSLSPLAALAAARMLVLLPSGSLYYLLPVTPLVAT